MSDESGQYTDGTEYEAYEHLLKSLHHANKAKKKFTDGSKGETVADNVVWWAEKSVAVAERYIETETNRSGGDE